MNMPIGSFLSHFREITLTTADEKKYGIKVGPLAKLGFKIVGLPHIGLRMRVRFITRLARKLPITSSILDAGCGYGVLSFELAQRGFSITSLDLDPDRIEQVNTMAQNFPHLTGKITAQVGSVLKTNYQSNQFDLSMCSEVIEHLSEDAKAVQELSRVTKSGGLIVISVPTDSLRNAKEFHLLGHKRPGYSKKMLQDLALKNNMNLIKYIPYEFTIGRIATRVHLSLKYPALFALFFYPFYLISFLDFLIQIGEANASVAVFKKN